MGKLKWGHIPIVIDRADIEGPHESLMQQVVGSAFERLRDHGERDLLDECRIRDARYAKAVEILTAYHVGTERIDREYPHAPNRHGHQSVMPDMRHSKSTMHIQRLRNAMTSRDVLIGALSLQDNERKAANDDAIRLADAVLGQCNCAECWRWR